MLKNCAAMGLIAASIAGLSSAPGWAANATAQDDRNVVYYSTRSTVTEAIPAVLQYCADQGGSGCVLLGSNTSDGYGAVAQSQTRVSTATGYDSQADADGVALNICARKTPAYDSCKVTLRFFDSNGSSSR